MSKSQQLRLSGLSFMAGSLGIAAILTGSDAFAIPGSWIGTLLLVGGMVALRAAYKGSVNEVARNFLLLGAIGPLLWLFVDALSFIEGYGTPTQMEATGSWILIFGGPVVPLLALTLFGFAALKDKPMPRSNWLPVLAGIWYPIAYSLLAGYLFTHNGKFPPPDYGAIQLIFVAQFFGLCLLGIAFLIDRSAQQGV